MARWPRIILPGQPCHVIQRGNNRQATFFAEDDYREYLDALRRASLQHDCAIHAYVLMTNHVHLLITPDREDGLSLVMQSVGRRYVRYINSVYGRSGTLWEGRFRSALVDSDRYLLTCYRYIELNPVRAGMVGDPGQYRWSSYHVNGFGETDGLVEWHTTYLRLGATDAARQQAYRALFASHLDEEAVALIRRNTQQNTVIGNERFQSEIRAALGRRVAKRGHGGDRRSKNFNGVSSDLTP